MQDRFKLFRRGAVFYCQDRSTGQQKSLQTRDKAEARRDGLVQQQNADLRVTVKADAMAATTSAQVAGESDAEVRADLQKDFRP